MVENFITKYDVLCWSLLKLRYISINNTPNIHQITSLYIRLFKHICNVSNQNIQIRLFAEFSVLLFNISVDFYRFEHIDAFGDEKSQSERFRDAKKYHYTITPLTLFISDGFVQSKLSDNDYFLMVLFIISNKLLHIIISTIKDVSIIEEIKIRSNKNVTTKNDNINLLDIAVDTSKNSNHDDQILKLLTSIQKSKHPWALFHLSSNLFDKINNIIYFCKLFHSESVSSILNSIQREEINLESKIINSSFFIISELSIFVLKQSLQSFNR